MIDLEIKSLGVMPYNEAWDLQKARVKARRATPDLADELLLVSHPPTYTIGRRGLREHLLLPQGELEAAGFTVQQVDRGGDLTYHGPGQLVGYPILDLKRWFGRTGNGRLDFPVYLRQLEEVIIQTLAEWDIHGWRYDGYTGVWVDRPSGPEKIAAIGIKVSMSGIAWHGFSLNVAPDLTHFGHIVPCGIHEHGVTSMVAVLGRAMTIEAVQPVVVEKFQQLFQYNPASVLVQ